MIASIGHRQFVVVVSAAFVSIAAAGSPFIPQASAILDGTREATADQVALQVSVTGQDTTRIGQAAIESVSVCSESACYQSKFESPRVIKIEDTRSGKAEVIVQMLIPHMIVRSVHFEAASMKSPLIGDVELSEPLRLSEPISAGEIMIVAKNSVVGGLNGFVPTDAVGLIRSNERRSLYYNPKFDMKASMDYGVSLYIPAGATARPQIFSVAIHDTGFVHPMIDIYPVLDLRKAATLSSVGIRNKRTDSQTDLGGVSRAIAPISKKVDRMGVFRLESGAMLNNGSLGEAGVGVMAATDTCVQRIQGKSSAISSSLSATGAVYLKGCEDVAPFVHIAVVNNNDTRVELDIAHGIGGTSIHEQPLTRIESLSTYDGRRPQVAVNGFTWVGDTGTGPNQWGCALGFVQNSRYALGNNMVDGCFATGNFAGNKLAVRIRPRVAASWVEGSVAPLWTDGVPYPFAIVSSSTSIVKNNVCATDSVADRWSAIGTASGNRLVFLSSTSSIELSVNHDNR